MSIKRSLLLASMALALVAFVVPATASATGKTWTHNGQHITTNKTTSFTGKAQFITALGNYKCEIEAHVILKPGTTGTVHGFTIPNTETCEGTGFLEECTMMDHEPTNLNWLLHTTTADTVHITNVEIWNEFTDIPGGEECPVEEAHLTFPTVTATPDEVASISSLTLSGEGICHVFGLETECEAEGTLNATEPQTYGAT